MSAVHRGAPMRIRAYEPGDFETLYWIDQECYPPGIAYSRDELAWFLEQPGADCLVATTRPPAKQNPTSGFIITESAGRAGHIITIDVIETHRRAGIGTGLLRAAERRMRERGVREVSLETATTNAPAIAFWQRHGYRTRGVAKNYYPGHSDALMMTKPLGKTKRAERTPTKGRA